MNEIPIARRITAGIASARTLRGSTYQAYKRRGGKFPYLDIANVFNYFFTRKSIFIMYSMGQIALPGGYGTVDEIFEVLAFNLRNRAENRKLVLLDRDYYRGLMEFLNKAYALGLESKSAKKLLL